MDKLPLTIWTPTSPLWIFGLVLAITFSVEGAIMLLLPFVPAWSRASLIQGLVDVTPSRF
jgi:hypothetical protein